MQLGWIDFSKTERNKILSVLDLLNEPGTLDELGIAPVRDGFSNIFFPGTSTIQTRAKYFFIVPYALKQLEKDAETNPNRILKSLDSIERKCGETLYKQNTQETGIIGKNSIQAGKWVKRTPASIYWAGLKTYGIFTGGNLSLTEYIRVSSAMKAQKGTLKRLGNRNDGAEENERDDANAGDLFKMQFWKIPLYSPDWFNTLSIKLTKEEARFLKEQIITSTEGSMMSYILEHNITEFLDCDSFESISNIIHLFPQNIQENYQLALSFSEFIFAVRVFYNIIISNGNNAEANVLLEELQPYLKEISSLDIDYILHVVEAYGNPTLRKFLKQAQEYMSSNDLESLKSCIKSREVQLKGANRAKTAHPGEFDITQWFGGQYLDYRFYNAKNIIRDIMESEDEQDAESK